MIVIILSFILGLICGPILVGALGYWWMKSEIHWYDEWVRQRGVHKIDESTK